MTCNHKLLVGKALKKSDLNITDSTGEVRLTLWADKATQLIDWNTSPIVAFRGSKVADYNGRTLSGCNTMLINPTLPEAMQLHNWRMQFGANLPVFASLSAGGCKYHYVDLYYELLVLIIFYS